MEEDGAKKKKPSQFGGIVRGARLTCQKTSLEIFRTVVVVARFDPSLYPQIVMDFFSSFFSSSSICHVLQHIKRRAENHLRILNTSVSPCPYLNTAVFVIAQYLTITVRVKPNILNGVRHIYIYIYVIDFIDIYFTGSFYGFVTYQGLIKIVSQVQGAVPMSQGYTKVTFSYLSGPPQEQRGPTGRSSQRAYYRDQY